MENNLSDIANTALLDEDFINATGDSKVANKVTPIVTTTKPVVSFTKPVLVTSGASKVIPSGTRPSVSTIINKLPPSTLSKVIVMPVIDGGVVTKEASPTANAGYPANSGGSVGGGGGGSAAGSSESDAGVSKQVEMSLTSQKIMGMEKNVVIGGSVGIAIGAIVGFFVGKSMKKNKILFASAGAATGAIVGGLTGKFIFTKPAMPETKSSADGSEEHSNFTLYGDAVNRKCAQGTLRYDSAAQKYVCVDMMVANNNPKNYTFKK